jgi:glycosyltransferase involved in cell wall biosynthesis
MKLITVVTPCYNEEENVRELYQQVQAVFATLPQYRYEHLFIDNASTDRTVPILKEIAGQDKSVKLIVNRRNFGQIRSPYYAFLQARGDAVVSIAADFQDPPALIPVFLGKWEEGYMVALGVKASSQESRVMFAIRQLYYALINRLSDVELIKDATGFGLYDRGFLELLRSLDEPYPYGRGLIAELGFEAATIPYEQPKRKRGLSKNNFYSLYDVAMVGITSHSKVPLRVATIVGFASSALSFLVALIYLLYKLIYWERFTAGVAPLVIGAFTAFSVQLFFLGLLGEYIAVIHTRVMRRPLVVEKERVNFD